MDVQVFKGNNTGSYYSFVIFRGKSRLALTHGKVTNLSLPETKVLGLRGFKPIKRVTFPFAALKSI